MRIPSYENDDGSPGVTINITDTENRRNAPPGAPLRTFIAKFREMGATEKAIRIFRKSLTDRFWPDKISWECWADTIAIPEINASER